MLGFSTLLALSLSLAAATTSAFPAHQSLAGLTREELAHVIPTLERHEPEQPPGPLNDTSTKLINDEDHPWKPLREGDIRGVCPGLNTLASHGYLPRNGIATPAQIINAVQEGFNMGNDLAIFLTYAAFLVDGNPITNLLSIGGKTRETGDNPPVPAIVGGLNTHAVFEGDTSMTRGDAFFGDNHSFNETLFQEFSDFSQRFGGGKYNLTVAAEYRWQRIQDSTATNPNFSFVSPRLYTAYAESFFPVAFFVDGRVSDGQLDMTAARSFLQDMRFPDDFFRANRSFAVGDIDVLGIFDAHPIEPGANHGVGNYIVDPTSAKMGQFCLLYTNYVNNTVRSLYPNPTGDLRTAMNTNLDYFFRTVASLNCTQIFPYGNY